MRRYASTNPATGETVAEFAHATDADVADALDRADAEFGRWRRRDLAERAAVATRIGAVLRERTDELAGLLTLEMGKPIAQARVEVDLAARIFEYYADHAAEFLADEELEVAGTGTAVVTTEPMGVLIGIMPWNFPYYQVARFAAPNLVLGNTILLKHARSCPQSAAAIAEAFHAAGLPEDAYIDLRASNEQIAGLIADRRVHGVSLTGSEGAGAAVAEVAGRHMKKVVLELGGSDALIVLDDADLDGAAAGAAAGRFFNTGQACTSAKRVIVLDSIYDAFLEKYVAEAAKWTAGDPADETTKLGPLSSLAARDELRAQVDDAVAKGATVHLGGVVADAPGAFYPATIISGVTPDMVAYRDELFGPAAAVYRVADEDAAVALANDTRFGLSAAVFSGDVERARRVADRLDTGMVWINSVSRSSPELPFGGVKASGIGRELGSFGIHEFANKKLIRVP